MNATLDVEERNAKIIKILVERDKEGFKYGEVKKYLEQLADEMDTTFKVVQNLYYNRVKEKATDTPKETVVREKEEIDTTDNLSRTDIINGKDVRLVKDEDKTEYYVAKDVFNSLNIDRTSALAKEGLKKEYKQYIPVKSSHGFVKTTVLKPTNLAEFLKFIIQKHTSSVIRDKAQEFLNHIENPNQNSINSTLMQENNEKTIVKQKPESQVIKTEHVHPIIKSASKEEKTEQVNPNVKPASKEEKIEQVNSTVKSASKEEKTEQVNPVVISTSKEEKIGQVNPIVKPVSKEEKNQASTTSYRMGKAVSFEKEEEDKQPRPNYKYGDILEAVVIHIPDYGAIIETLDEYKMKGLIHIGDIRYGHVSNVHMYFTVGDKIRAKVKRYDKENNRLNLTVKELKGPYRIKDEAEEKEKEEKFEEVMSEENGIILEDKPKNDVLAQELLKVKDRLTLASSPQETTQDTKVEAEIAPKVEPKVESVVGENKILSSGGTNMVTGETNLVIQSSQGLEIEGNKELENIISRLNNKIGAISPQAREKMLELLNENSIVEFTIAMIEVLPEFKADLGLMLLGEIEKKMSECL
ncbi:S1 RNA-binding domain-containing protein [Bacillus cereus group sp. TH152-1LC]|uniref:S1 RNA-binding domain-containing protein n=1 Tax=Bacillus cereus group sp. TH152-1LC TaxID=3018060 RepID=UPI0022DFC297|nr:S1 RNA-binding domain-containing protein [Bacillus cereus group sp. TH152-1LC]MDA1674602.1 S1 RNA-binding domain-containing protein [Bacillus cereus group sp. TH152-1LC]